MATNAKDADGVVHGVAYDDDGGLDGTRDYGQLVCGTWFFWRLEPLSEEDKNRWRMADPMNHTREKVTCIECLGFA